MKRILTLLLALLPVASAAPLCRVTAHSRPLSWASSLRIITVALEPDCPPDGYAVIRLGSYGGPGSKVLGRAVLLDAVRPVVRFAGQPIWRSVLWTAKSGRLYQVQIPQEVSQGDGTEGED